MIKPICSIYKKGIITVLFLFVGLVGIHAQETVSTSGGDASGSGGSSSYTAGQVVYTTNTGSNGSIAQGVQQPYEISIVNGIEVTEINLELMIYPNPTTDQFILTIANYNNENLTYKLYDISGKLIETEQLSKSKTSINVQDLKANTYLLHVFDQNAAIKTFKIVKK